MARSDQDFDLLSAILRPRLAFKILKQSSQWEETPQSESDHANRHAEV
jgi:hypothetical protein